MSPRTRSHAALAATAAIAGCEALFGVDFDAAELSGSVSGAGGGPGGASTSGSGSGGGCTGAECVPTDALLLWLRSDVGLTGNAGELSWTDQVTGLDAVAKNPPDSRVETVPTIVHDSKQFGGRPAVRFDGEGDRIALPTVEGSFEAGFSAFFVLRTLAKSHGDGFFVFGNEDASGKFRDVIALGREGDADRLRYSVQDVYEPAAWWEGIVQAYEGITTGAEHAEIVVVVQEPDNATAWFYRNGKPAAKNWGDAPLPRTAHRDASYLGWVPLSSGFDGDIAEVIVYRRATDDTERATVEAYLAAKYGVQLTPPCSGDCPEVLAVKQGMPTRLTAHGSRVVWTNHEGGEVMTIDDLGAPRVVPRKLHGVVSNAIHPSTAGTDGVNVYWGTESGLHRIGLDGNGFDSKLSGGRIENVGVNGQTAYSAILDWYSLMTISTSAWDSMHAEDMSAKVGLFAFDDQFIYWVQDADDDAADGVFRAPKTAPGAANREVIAPGWTPALAVDASSVYRVVPTPVGAAIERIDKTAMGSPQVLVEESWIGDIAVDGSHLYFSSLGDRAIKRLPVAGGAVTTIATDQTLPSGLVVAPSWLVWANQDGTIVRMPKPP